MSEKIVLIDGHSILHRAFYGIPDLTNAEGLHTNAIYGFLNIMFKILEEEKPEYLTVAFDVHAPTFRHEMAADYKGTRKPMPEELRQQVPVMKDVLRSMGIPVMEKAGLEADDILGTISKICEAKGMEVSIISGDRDLLQLATQKVKIRIPKTKRTGTEIEDYLAADVKEKYQVTPTEFIDVKALMGDTSDNISGVPGIGEKGATKLIVEYGSIENAYAHVDEIKAARTREALREHYDLAQKSKILATIKVDAEIDFSVADALMGNLYTPEAYVFFKRLEFKNMLARFDADSTPINQVEEYFSMAQMIDGAEESFAKAAQILGQNQKLGIAVLEDNQELAGVVFTFGSEEAVLLPVEGFVTADYLGGKLGELTSWINEGLIITPDLKALLRHMKVDEQANVFDTGIAAYLINPLKNDYKYEDIANEYLNLMIPSRTDLLKKLSYQKAIDEEPEGLLKAACYYGYVSFMAYDKLNTALEELEMKTLYAQIEMPLVYTLSDMEQLGIAIDAEALKQYGQQLVGRITQLEQAIYEAAGETFNINSPKQLGLILFEKLEMPFAKKTKSGYSTAADVLEKLAVDYPIVSDILEYRQLTKLKSTYADGLAAYIDEDGRIRSTFNQTITATGRISSTEPNLQNIPIRMELGRMIRKVFHPKPGYVFLDADYSQIELRVLAHMSGDQNLIAAYANAQDIHRATASQVFHVPFDEVTDLQRRNAKAVNFGIVYGISSFGLSQDLSITRKEAQEYIQRYFDTYPGIKTFLDRLVEDAKELGYAKTMYGRRRPVPELKSSNFMQRSFGERIAMNSPIQGTAADIIKIAMNRVRGRLTDEGLKSKLILQVHDELLIETAEDELEQVKVILAEEMQNAAQMDVKLEVDMHTGYTWYEAK